MKDNLEASWIGKAADYWDDELPLGCCDHCCLSYPLEELIETDKLLLCEDCYKAEMEK